MSPSEQEARQQIDALLAASGWSVQDAGAAHISVENAGVSLPNSLTCPDSGS